MCTYLDQVGSTYYFRRVVPAELQPFIRTVAGNPRTEFKVSLRTKDRETAKRLLPDHVKQSDRVFDAARAKLRQAAPSGAATPADPFASMTLEQFHYWEQHNREQLQAAIAEDTAMEDAEAWATGLPPDHPAAILLREERERGDRYQLEAHRYRKRKRKDGASGVAGDSQGGNAASPLLSQPSPAIISQVAAMSNLEPVSLTGLFGAYVETGALGAAGAKEWSTGIAKFVAFVGHDDARRVTQADVLRWRNHVRDEPQKNGKPRSPQRINVGYLAPLRSAFKHGMSEMLIEHNPAAAVPKLHVPKAIKTRDRMFTKEEQRTILRAALDAGTDERSAFRGLVRRWVPWLCAYTGARVNEITQLRAGDIQQMDGHWIIHITPEAGNTKNKEFRNVPVHEHLIEQGFLAMVEGKKGPLFYDPNLGGADSERGQNKKAGERLAAWVRSLGVTDKGIMPNHAWRHTFKSLAMEVGMDERAADYLQGHASVAVSRKVYTHHTIGRLAEQMALIPRYDLTEPDPR